MKRCVCLGMTNADLWLALAGQELPAGAKKLDAQDALFWLHQAMPPSAHGPHHVGAPAHASGLAPDPAVLHSLSAIADALGYPFHGTAPFADLPWLMDTLESALKDRRLVAFRGASTEGGGKGPTKADDPPKRDEPKKEKVNPVVEPVSLVLVVKKFAKNPTTSADEAYTDPKRQEITLKTDAAFDGTGTFNCDKPDSVKFYSAKTGGTEIRLNGTDNVFPPGGAPAWASGATLTGGVKLYAEGLKPSAKKDDITISLSLSGGSKTNGPDDKSTITSVEVTIDICKSRTRAQVGATPPGDPDPMSKDDKVFAGRYLHKQDGTSHGRALVILRAVQPTDYVGEVEIKVVGAVSLFEKDLPPPGAPAGADPAAKTTYKTADLKKAPAKMWAQATAASAGPRDIEVQAGIKGVEPLADRCKITGVQFTQIKAIIKGTPATPANPAWAPAPAPHPGFPVPVNHEMTVSSASEDFTVNQPLPLVRNAQPDIALELTATPPNLPISWDVVRNPRDHATLGGAADKPSLSADPGGNRYKQLLNANNKGSFHVRPFIDCNGSGTFEDREPSIPLNLILFDAVVAADRSVANPGAATESINAARAGVSTGSWPAGAGITAADLAAAAMAFDLDVDVTGGGPDGKLGLDYLFCGLSNNQWVEHADGAYLDAVAVPNAIHSLKSVYASNFPNAARQFNPGDPAPVLFNMPLLDSGRYPAGQGGLGGDAAVMSGSNAHTLAAVQPALGERRTIQCVDSPSNPFPRFHPVNAAAVLQLFKIDWQFVGNFVLWTELNKTRGSGGGSALRPADRVYSVVRTQTWSTKGEWTTKYTAPIGVTRVSYTATNAGTTISPVGRAQDHAVQVRPPATVSDPVLGNDASEVLVVGGGAPPGPPGGGGSCSVALDGSTSGAAGLFFALLAGVVFWRRRGTARGRVRSM